jgi:hypothetical protein
MWSLSLPVKHDAVIHCNHIVIEGHFIALSFFLGFLFFNPKKKEAFVSSSPSHQSFICFCMSDQTKTEDLDDSIL